MFLNYTKSKVKLPGFAICGISQNSQVGICTLSSDMARDYVQDVLACAGVSVWPSGFH